MGYFSLDIKKAKVRKEWGYFSKRDLEVHEFAICESCYEKMIDQFVIPVKKTTHGQPLTAAGADFAATVKNLGGDAENPFAVFEESREVFAERREALKEWAAKQAAVEKSWRAEHKELARKLDDFLSGKLPEIDYKSIEMKADVATRAASATVLGVFAEKIDNMIVASADLSNSDKTDGYLKKTKAFTKGDFSGKFFQAGVSELTMACGDAWRISAQKDTFP